MEHFEYDGRHLMIDAITTTSQKIAQATTGISFLEEIVEKIDMTMILPPITVKFPHATSEMDRILRRLEAEGLEDSQTANSIRHDLKLRKDESYGYSSFVMIAESHISIHTFPELKYISFDCYSCKWFDVEKVLEIFKAHFDIKNMEIQVVKRRVPDAG